MLVSSFVGGTGAAAAIGLQNTTTSFSGFVGPAIFGVLREQTGGFDAGMLIVAVGLVLAAMIVLALGRAMGARRILGENAKVS
jgi:cyanate permease